MPAKNALSWKSHYRGSTSIRSCGRAAYLIAKFVQILYAEYVPVVVSTHASSGVHYNEVITIMEYIVQKRTIILCYYYYYY